MPVCYLSFYIYSHKGILKQNIRLIINWLFDYSEKSVLLAMGKSLRMEKGKHGK